MTFLVFRLSDFILANIFFFFFFKCDINASTDMINESLGNVTEDSKPTCSFIIHYVELPHPAYSFLALNRMQIHTNTLE